MFASCKNMQVKEEYFTVDPNPLEVKGGEVNYTVTGTFPSKTFVKKVYAAIDAGDKAAADEALKAAISEISKAASKGIYHKSTASRKISRLTKAVNKIA